MPRRLRRVRIPGACCPNPMSGGKDIGTHPHPGPLPSDGRGRTARRVDCKPPPPIGLERAPSFPLPSDGRGPGEGKVRAFRFGQHTLDTAPGAPGTAPACRACGAAGIADPVIGVQPASGCWGSVAQAPVRRPGVPISALPLVENLPCYRRERSQSVTATSNAPYPLLYSPQTARNQSAGLHVPVWPNAGCLGNST